MDRRVVWDGVAGRPSCGRPGVIRTLRGRALIVRPHGWLAQLEREDHGVQGLHVDAWIAENFRGIELFDP